MNDYYNKAKSTESQIFHSFSRSAVRAWEQSHLFFIIFLAHNQEWTG